MKAFCTLILVVILAGCSSAQTKESNRPDWVDGKTAGTYPSTKYVTAVGNGLSREAAVQSAKNALASTFLQKVESQVSAESKSNLTEDTTAKSSGEASSKSRTAVQISTNIQLRGAEIAEYWQDPETKEHYAFAVLDKLKVRNSYLLDLSRMKERLLSLHSSFKAKPDQKTGREILDQSNVYADLAREAGAVGTPTAQMDPLTPAELQTIREKLLELKHGKVIALNLTAEGEEAQKEAGDLRALVANCLQEKGYSVADGEGSAPVKFSGTYRVNSKHLKMEGFSKYEFSVRASLSQGAHSERIFLPKESSGRVRDQAFDGIKVELSDSVCAAVAQAL